MCVCRPETVSAREYSDLVQGFHIKIDFYLRILPAKDRVVDPRTAKRLYDAAGDPKELWMIEGADHYQAMDELVDEVHPRLLEFFNRCVE